MTKFNSDVDIDFGDRDLILQHIKHTSASMHQSSGIPRKHNSGIYVTDAPYDPINEMCSLNYVEAENRGYIKLDLLNVWLYKLVRDEQHLTELLREPDWGKLIDRQFFEKLIHIGNHYDTMFRMPETINSIPRLAMFLAIIRPGKVHLIGKSWAEVAQHIWEKDHTGYSFKKSHAVAYAHLVTVHMNLLVENPNAHNIQT